MRETLFRGKRLDNGEWVRGNLFVSETDGRTYILAGSRRFTIDWEVATSTVGQFTGLTDKNGKKIFEGDILTLRTGIPYVVRFEDGAFFFENTEIPIRFANKFTVIGNIHDNPELLEAPNA